MKITEYRHCTRCEFADWECCSAGKCQLDEVVGIEYFSCVPVDIVKTTSFNQLEDADKEKILLKLYKK